MRMGNSREIVLEVAEKFLLPKKETVEMVEYLFERMVEIALSGTPIELPGFGKFFLKETKPRVIKPFGQEARTVPSKKVLKFKPTKSLKDTLKGA